MDCIFAEYIKFVDNFLVSYYKILLDNKYDKNMVRPFIDRFIEVRYYNKYSVKEESFTERLNKELNNVAHKLLGSHDSESKKELIKNIFALFSYLLFIDGCSHFSDLSVLLKTMFNDNNISLKYTGEAKKKATSLVREYISKKVDFFKLFNSGEFYLKGKKLEEHLYSIDLGQRCNLPKLYSDYAIKAAYDSEVVYENRLYLAVIMLSSKILSEVIALNFDNNYIIPFPVSLFGKAKKMGKFLRAIDDDMILDKVSLKFTYKEYKDNKKNINALITEGYSISLELDDSYTTDFDNLFLFSYVLVRKDASYHDIIINNKDAIKTKVVEV